MIIVRETKDRVIEKYVSTGDGVIKYEFVQPVVFDRIVSDAEDWRTVQQGNREYLDLSAVWQPCVVSILDSLNPLKRCKMPLDSRLPCFSKNLYILTELLTSAQVVTSVVDALGNVVW